MNLEMPVIFDLDEHPLTGLLCGKLPGELGYVNARQFPDGESYLRIETSVKGRQCIIVTEFSHSNGKFLPFAFLASTLKELGAISVGLVAPYLGYMRQDYRFNSGEVVTSRIFAELLSQQVDWLITLDPHLHRYHSLNEIYTIPSKVVGGASLIAEWLGSVKNVFLVGPDLESMQWVSEISSQCGHEFVIGEKQRLGDREVVVSLPDLSKFAGMTAIIIDDVISSGHTILECIKSLRAAGTKSIICACVHGVFADDSDKLLVSAGLKSLISTNTIPHETNRLDVSGVLLSPINECLQLYTEVVI